MHIGTALIVSCAAALALAVSADAAWHTQKTDSRLVLSDAARQAVLTLSPGVTLGVTDAKATRIYWNSDLWTVRFNGHTLGSGDFLGKLSTSGKMSAEIGLTDTKGFGIEGSLLIDWAASGRLKMKLKLNAGDRGRMAVVFPALGGIRHAGSADLHYCFPKRASVINNTPADLREPYSGAFPLQFMDVWGPHGGVYLMTEDLSNTYRYFHLAKTSARLTMEVEYPEKERRAFESVSTVIAFHDGDWHAAFDAYRSWVKTWYRPAAPRKQWFREVFNLRQQFLRFYSITDGTYYDSNSRTFTFAEGLERDRRFFGSVEYLHLFDWGMQAEHGLGDYSPWGPGFSLDDFRKSIDQARASGVPVGLYVEGYLVSLDSKIGKAHGTDWEILRADGSPVRAYGIYNMCPAVKPWQDYLASVYARVSTETGADGFYVDQYGYGFADYVCHARNHGHEVPAPPLTGEGETLAKIRKALGPNKLLYTEYPPTDVQSQLLDGAFEKAVVFGSDELSPCRINLTRFALPDFKTFEIVMLDEPLGDRVDLLRLVFFNGEGIWLEGPADKWYSERALDFIRKMHRVMREYRDCFTSLLPVPLVPTGNPQVFANQFPGRKRTLWTIYNSSGNAVRGELLHVRHIKGARYRDVWNDRELKPRIGRRSARISLEIGPKEIGCVVQEEP